MPLSTSIHSYLDVVQVLSAAQEAGGGVYHLDTPGKATSWRQRAYYYRKLLARADAAKHGNVPGYSPSTPWDDLNLTIDPTDARAVRIQFSVIEGKLEGLGGESLRVAKPTSAPALPAVASEDAELLKIAEGLAVEIDRS
jgi:hypothetical protein